MPFRFRAFISDSANTDGDLMSMALAIHGVYFFVQLEREEPKNLTRMSAAQTRLNHDSH